MCLVTSSPEKDYFVGEREYYAPRPVSNYHGGSRSGGGSRHSRSRPSSSYVPADRVSYRSSSYRSVSREGKREHGGHGHHSHHSRAPSSMGSAGEVYRKTSRTYAQ